MRKVFDVLKEMSTTDIIITFKRCQGSYKRIKALQECIDHIKECEKCQESIMKSRKER